MRRRAAKAPSGPVVHEAHACSVCGAANAALGIGQPLLKERQWFCHTHWLAQPATQALLAARVRQASDAEGEMTC